MYSALPPDDPDLEAAAVRSERLVVITPESHPLSDDHEIDIRELKDYPMVAFSRDSGLRTLIDPLFEQTGTEPVIAYETTEDEVVAGLVANDFGYAVLPYMDLLEKLAVNIHSISYPNVERTIYLVTDRRTYMPPVVRSFIDMVISERRQ